MNLLDIFIKIGIDDSEFERGISNAQTQMGGFSAFTIAKGNLIAEAFKFAANAIFDVAKKAFDVGSDFEASMSKVQAVAGASSEELVALTDKALEMGQKTKYSASEAADALYYMAQAGWNTQQMTEGLAGVMNLAAASGEDLATTSDIVTDAMTAFGMSADESVRFADVLTKAANDTNTSVGMLGETFKYVAPVAGTLGYSVEDVAIATGLMANAGVKSSQAGTSLRRMLTNLVSPTDKMAAAMSELGISITGKGGEVKPLYELLVDLREGFSGLTEAEQAEYASIIASQTGMSGLLAIVNATDDEFDRLTDSMYQASGAAEHTAKTMQNNLKGKLEELSSAAETFYIKIYQDVQEPLKYFAETATDALNEVTEAYGERGLVGALSKGAEIIGGAFESAIDAITDPNNLSKALSSGATLIEKVAEGIGSSQETVNDSIRTIVNRILDFVTLPSTIEDLGNIGITIIDTIFNLGEGALELIRGVASDIIGKIVEFTTDEEAQIQLGTSAGTIIATLSSKLLGFGVDLFDTGVSIGTAIFNGIATGDWSGLGGNIVSAFGEGFKQTWDALWPTLSAKFNGAVEDLKGFIVAAEDAWNKVWGYIESAGQAIEDYYDTNFGDGRFLTPDPNNMGPALGATVGAGILQGGTLSDSVPTGNLAEDMWDYSSAGLDIPGGGIMGRGGTVVVQNIYSQEHSAAELMEEARLAQDRGRLYMLN